MPCKFRREAAKAEKNFGKDGLNPDPDDDIAPGWKAGAWELRLDGGPGLASALPSAVTVRRCSHQLEYSMFS